MSEEKIKILERSLKRERKARKQAEAILEQKSMELFRLNEKLSSSNKMLEALLDDQSSQLNIIVDNSPLATDVNKLLSISDCLSGVILLFLLFELNKLPIALKKLLIIYIYVYN